MRVALVNNIYVDQLGYYYISAALKQAGHEVEFFLANRSLPNRLQSFAPQLVGLTAVTGNHAWAIQMAEHIRQMLPESRVILGGPHATYQPDVLHQPGLDFICRGEGERSIVGLVEDLEAGGDGLSIAGISGKKNGEIVDNGFATYEEDLDSLPFPDRSMYRRFRFSGHNLHPLMITSRGCPFRCTFCFEPTLADLTRDRGKFVRFRSVGNVIEEAVELRDRYGARSVEFEDDIFGMHRPWLREFASRWSHEVGLPFNCLQRADLLDEEVVSLLADAGCRAVAFGIESGSARVRNEVLRKDVSDDQIYQAAAAMKRHGIRIITNNILGAPHETIDEVWQTLKMNQRVRPDYSFVSLMQPYPGSQVFDQAVEAGMLDGSGGPQDYSMSFHQDTPLQIPHKVEVANLQRLFYLGVALPVLTPLIRRMVRLPENRFFYMLFLVNHLLAYWIRVKRIPARHLAFIALNVMEIARNHRAGLFRQRLWQRPRGPSVKQVVESGAI